MEVHPLGFFQFFRILPFLRILQILRILSFLRILQKIRVLPIYFRHGTPNFRILPIFLFHASDYLCFSIAGFNGGAALSVVFPLILALVGGTAAGRVRVYDEVLARGSYINRRVWSDIALSW